MKACVLVFDGVDELDAFGPFEVLTNARDDVFSQVVLASLDGGDIVTDRGVGLTRLAAAANDSWDLVVVPGGGWRQHRGVWFCARDARIKEFLVEQDAAGAVLASVCTGAMLLAHAGLLNDVVATTHHAVIPELVDMDVTVGHERIIDCGRIVTAGGVVSGIDMALWLVERFSTPERAAGIARRMAHDRRGPIRRVTSPPSEGSSR